jgi:hypothetical protein
MRDLFPYLMSSQYLFKQMAEEKNEMIQPIDAQTNQRISHFMDPPKMVSDDLIYSASYEFMLIIQFLRKYGCNSFFFLWDNR